MMACSGAQTTSYPMSNAVAGEGCFLVGKSTEACILLIASVKCGKLLTNGFIISGHIMIRSLIS